MPSFLVAGLLFFLPESPKFLLAQGHSDQAMEIFQQIYATNTGNPPEDYPVGCEVLPNYCLPAAMPPWKKVGYPSRFM